MNYKYIIILCSCYLLFFLFNFGYDKVENEVLDIRVNYEVDVNPIISTNLEIPVDLLEKNRNTSVSEEEYKVLLDIVEAEAEGEDEEGKLLIVNVILNRVESKQFPNTIVEVVFQKNDKVTQFSPINGTRFQNLEISEETITAVERGLNGEDISQGALYFVARKIADNNAMNWFDENLTYLFTHGGHEFFY